MWDSIWDTATPTVDFICWISCCCSSSSVQDCLYLFKESSCFIPMQYDFNCTRTAFCILSKSLSFLLCSFSFKCFSNTSAGDFLFFLAAVAVVDNELMLLFLSSSLVLLDSNLTSSDRSSTTASKIFKSRNRGQK
jgi:hypothetical protein